MPLFAFTPASTTSATKKLERYRLGKLAEKIISTIESSMESTKPLSGEICLTPDEDTLLFKFDLADHLEKWGYKTNINDYGYDDPSSMLKFNPTTPAPSEQRVFPPFSALRTSDELLELCKLGEGAVKKFVKFIEDSIDASIDSPCVIELTSDQNKLLLSYGSSDGIEAMLIAAGYDVEHSVKCTPPVRMTLTIHWR